MAAVTLQRVLRGFVARSQTDKAMKAIKAVRAKIEAANEYARANPNETLGARLQAALWTLQHGTQLTHIIRACITLELSTRYSKICCQVMAESTAPDVVYGLIRTLNRSPPHQKILKFALMTFRNIVKHGGNFARHVAAPPVASAVFMDLLQVYRDKPEVFHLAVRLATSLAGISDSIRRDMCTAHQAARMTGILQLLQRKTLAEMAS
ncbi:unnamed protein product, partial [Chrysoparadoxa australica]